MYLSGEISLLKSQLKDSQGDQTTRNHELLHIRAQVREYAAQLETKEVDNKRLQAETQTLREQVSRARVQGRTDQPCPHMLHTVIVPQWTVKDVDHLR